MENKIVTVAAIGLGGRGWVYTSNMFKKPDKYKVLALCDIDKVKADRIGEELEVAKENVFYDEDEFFKEKRADLCVISTQDQQHVGHAIKALALGYDLLLEKPISNKESECRKLLKAQQQSGRKIFVCHVLRYAPAFVKVKEILDSGVIGDIVMIDSVENVYFFHQAHSFVRGNWRRKDETSPMILAKCCHDLDLLQWYAGSKCETISSIGDLRYFKKENQPEGAADRCTDCKFADTCPYSAVRGYLTNKFWGGEALTNKRPITDEIIMDALRTGPYGRCVYACDNDVVDNQIVMARFANGITANLRMTAFTAGGGRTMKFYGTLGELEFDQDRKFIEVKPFGKPVEKIDTDNLVERGYGHGGGDQGIVNGLYDLMTGKSDGGTTLAHSLESHLMAFTAEKSRLKGGKVYKIKH